MTMTDTKPTTFIESIEALKEQQRTGRPMPLPLPTMLPPKEIRFADLVFQPRTFEGTRAAADDHVKGLKESIRYAADNLLDPVVVWWSGRRWIVIDGHHRMIAYNQLAKDTKQPLIVGAVRVEVFVGSLHEAICKAVELNSRNKLPMSKDEKIERAWKLVALEDDAFSKKRIAMVSGVSVATVGIMRARLGKLKGEPLDDVKHPLDVTWKQLLKMDSGAKPDVDEAWIDRLAKGYAARLSHQFRDKLARNPTVTARMLEFYSQNLPRQLLEEWRDEIQAMDFDAREVEGDF